MYAPKSLAKTIDDTQKAASRSVSPEPKNSKTKIPSIAEKKESKLPK